MTNKRGLTATIALLVLAAIALPGCRERPARRPAALEPALEVRTARVVEREAPGFVELTGSLAGGHSVSLSTKLMSQITMLDIVEGQRVKAGQVLVVIDDSDIVAMRNEAAAYRAEAAAVLSEVDAVVAQGRSAKAAAEAGVSQAEAVLAESRKDLERTERLVEEDTLPRVQADKARLAVKVAEESLNQARAGVAQAEEAVAQAEARRPQVKAREQQAEAKDQQAAALQEYAVLKAPFDGVVTHKYFEAGQLAIPGQPILTLDDVTGFKVMLAVPEDLAAGLSVGSAVEVLVDSPDGIGRSLEARLSVLGAAADPASHVVRAEATLAVTAGLLSGRFVRVRVPSGKRSQLLIPATALVREGEQCWVWRVSGAGRAARTAVDAGEESGGLVEVLRGVGEGDEVIDSPSAELYPGTVVKAEDGAVEAAQ